MFAQFSAFLTRFFCWLELSSELTTFTSRTTAAAKTPTSLITAAGQTSTVDSPREKKLLLLIEKYKIIIGSQIAQ